MHSQHPDTTCPLRLQPASHSWTSSCGWLPPDRSKYRLNRRLYAFSREAQALTHKIWQVQWTEKWHNVIPKVWFLPHQISWFTVCHEISFSETLKLTWNLPVFNPDTAGLCVIIVLCVQNSHLISSWKRNKTMQFSYLLKQFTMALPDRLPVILAPASAMVLAVSLRLSRMAPIRSMWLPLALKLPVKPPTLPSPMLGLCLASATEVVSKCKYFKEISVIINFPLLRVCRDFQIGSIFI